MRRITKLFQTKATSIDDQTKTIRFKISDNQTDRMGERVDQASWNFNNYLANPIVLWGHDPDEPENVLGQTTELSVSPDGSETYATMKFDDDINPKAGLVWKQLLRGTLRCVSVGFINHSEEMDNDTPVLKDNELLEISVVPIPANPRAVALSLKEGTLSTKDAKWLMDSMRKEASFIEDQMKQSEEHKEKSMTDEQASALIDAVTKLTEKVEANQTANDERLTALTAQLDELKPAEEVKTEEEDEKPTVSDEEEAKEVKNDEEEASDDVAKDGDDDQSGAAADEFDPNAELTPELQAEIDAALEAELANA